MRFSFAALAALAALAVTAAASAPAWAHTPAPRPRLAARLDYTHALDVSGCPTEAQLRDVLTGHFGYDPIDPGGKGLLKLRVTRRGAKLRAELVVENGGGATWRDAIEKATNCADVVLDAALSFRIAVNLHLPPPPAPAATLPLPRPIPPSPLPSPSPTPPAKDAPSISSPAAPTPPLLYRISAGSSVAFGLTPGVSLGGGAAFAFRWPRASLGLGIRGLRSLSTIDADAHTPIRSSLVLSTLDACGHVRFFFGCGIASFGLIHFDAGDGDRVRPDTLSPFVAGLGLRAGVEIGFAGRFTVRLSADGMPLLTQTTLLLDGREVWKTSLFFASFDAGLSMSL